MGPLTVLGPVCSPVVTNYWAISFNSPRLACQTARSLARLSVSQSSTSVLNESNRLRGPTLTGCGNEPSATLLINARLAHFRDAQMTSLMSQQRMVMGTSFFAPLSGTEKSPDAESLTQSLGVTRVHWTLSARLALYASRLRVCQVTAPTLHKLPSLLESSPFAGTPTPKPILRREPGRIHRFPVARSSFPHTSRGTRNVDRGASFSIPLSRSNLLRVLSVISLPRIVGNTSPSPPVRSLAPSRMARAGAVSGMRCSRSFFIPGGWNRPGGGVKVNLGPGG